MGLAFPNLTAQQIQALAPFGKAKLYKKGKTIWKAGQAGMCMYVVVKGAMDILDGRTGAYVTSHRRGSFSGDVDVVSGRPSLVTGIAHTDSEFLEIPADCVRNIAGEQPELGEIILRAFLVRRALLMEQNMAGLLIIGSRYCPDTLRVREFLARNHIPAHWEDLETSEGFNHMLQEFEVDPEDTPMVVLQNGRILRTPSNSDLAEALGIKRALEDRVYDLVIVGAGPAGLAAAVYGASEGLSTILVDGNSPGGQAGTSSRIENYMGFPYGVSGQQLTDSGLIQAEKFGAQIVVPAEVLDITCRESGGHTLRIEGMDEVHCRCVILASGASYRRLEVENQERFEGRGIFYSATHVESMLCKDQAIAVVGAGNSAGQAAVFMAQNAACVHLIVRGEDLKKSMSSYLSRRIEGSDHISVHLNSEICSIEGDEALESVTVRDRKRGKVKTISLGAIFVMIGAVPHTDWLPDKIVRDQKGFVLTGVDARQSGKWSQVRPPFYLETTCPGVFAAGDVRASSIKRVASAVGEGSMAVAFVHQFMAL